MYIYIYVYICTYLIKMYLSMNLSIDRSIYLWFYMYLPGLSSGVLGRATARGQRSWCACPLAVASLLPRMPQKLHGGAPRAQYDLIAEDTLNHVGRYVLQLSHTELSGNVVPNGHEQAGNWKVRAVPEAKQML